MIQKYRLPETTSAEDLACNWSTVLNFEDKIFLTGYYFMGRGKASYFGAIYSYTTEDKSCEGEIGLQKISEELFMDNGSAIAWCIQNAR